MENQHRSEAIVLAEAYAYTRNLSRFYLGKLKGSDPHFRPNINGKELNCWLWIAGHLVWAENWLLRSSLGYERLHLPWAKHFKIGSDGTPNGDWPDPETVMKAMKESQQLAIEGIRVIKDKELDEIIPSATMSFLESKRAIIIHAIRHDASHAGHLGWICQAMGIQTI